MKTKNILHNISHMKWLFLALEIYLIIYCFISLPSNLVTIIGIAIFVTGIYLGLDSLSDIERMPIAEKRRFQKNNYANRLSKIILLLMLVLVLISILFFSLQFFGNSRNESLFNEFFNLGLNIWAFILGLLCLLKNIDDKQQFVTSQNDDS